MLGRVEAVQQVGAQGGVQGESCDPDQHEARWIWVKPRSAGFSVFKVDLFRSGGSNVWGPLEDQHQGQPLREHVQIVDEFLGDLGSTAARYICCGCD